MNSAALVATTYRRFGNAADGTSTREVICMINKWRAQINWKGIYNVRDPLEKGAKFWKERMREQFVLSLKPLLPSIEEYEEQQAPQMKANDRISHFSPRNCYPIYSQLCLVVVILTKA